MRGDDRMRRGGVAGRHGNHPNLGGTPAPERVSASSGANPHVAVLK